MISFCSRFINYQPTSLERSYRHELLTEHDLGIAVDLILPDAYVHVIKKMIDQRLSWKTFNTKSLDNPSPDNWSP